MTAAEKPTDDLQRGIAALTGGVLDYKEFFALFQTIMNPENFAVKPWTRRRWVKQFMLGSAVALGLGQGWRGRLLADIAQDVPPTDILPLQIATDFP